MIDGNDIPSDAYGEYDYAAYNASMREKIEAPWRVKVERLRAALAAELTHGGIADRTAQVAAILGTGHADMMEVGERLDADRDAFRARIQAVLDES